MPENIFVDSKPGVENIEGLKENVFEICDIERLDVSVSKNCGITRSAAAKLIEDGNVFVNGNRVMSKSIKPDAGAKITVLVPKPKECCAKPQNIDIKIVYEDDDLLVVNKPQGMVVHPAPGNYENTLVNALLYHCKGNLSGINGVIRPGIVHRIDKNTSGLLIVAKNDASHKKLASQIKEHSFTRIYNAVLLGNLKDDEGTIDLPIGRHFSDRKKMAVTQKNSKNAVTHYKVLKRYNGYCLVMLKLETGRTHQIRVHMSYIGHPVLGDTVYSKNDKGAKFGLSGQCLHAKVIGFVHPSTGKYMEFDSPLPEYFESVLKKLDKLS